ncbi:MAG: winged helix-turn-helix domain-containing protein [Bacteroidales bacterium]|nr:winged helix-turn-helix domain-containing protein [Bacteroidales bacterium]MCD8386308.1 winged helix-turn-helix domain-containing protein [Bacteroidales bacterium]
MNTDTIGLNAGQIWQALNEAEAMGIKQLKKVTKLKDKEVFAAIGWLAREGKLMIDVDPEDPKELIITLERN